MSGHKLLSPALEGAVSSSQEKRAFIRSCPSHAAHLPQHSIDPSSLSEVSLKTCETALE